MSVTYPTNRYSATDAVRTSQDITVWDESCAYPIDATTMHTATVGGGSVTHNAAQSLYVVGCTTAGGDSALLRSHARPRASARHTRTVALTGFATANGLNCTKRWGAFSDTDGWYFQLVADALSVVRRSSVTGAVVDTVTARAAWSVPSAKVWDTTIAHTYEVRDAWPSGDAEFFIDGELVHVMPATERIRTPRLPVSVEVLTTSTTVSAGSFSLAAATVLVDERPAPDRTFALEAGATGFAAAAPLLAVRPLATVSSQPNGAELEAATLTLTSDAACLVQVVVGGTVTGTFTAPTGSLGESCAAPTGITGGRVVASYRVASTLAVSGADVFSDAVRVLGNGTTETLAIVVASASGAPVTVRAALVWRETR